MSSSLKYFWVIDDKLYTEDNPEFKTAFDKKCEQWDKTHPNGYKDVTDPDDPGNHIAGGHVCHSEKYGKIFVTLDPGVDEKFLPEIKELFHLNEAENVQYSRNGQKKCFFNFSDWHKEHPDFKMAKPEKP